MKYKWVKELGNKEKLIIFFNGWGMDESVISHLDTYGYDLLVFYDYRFLDLDDEVFAKVMSYNERFVVAWSMGVLVSTLFDLMPKKMIAVNGTPYPISDEFGIPVNIYKNMMSTYNELSKNQFMQKMFVSKDDIERFKVPNRTVEEQKEELVSLMKYYGKNKKFDKVIISEKDRIIPTKMQKNYWNNCVVESVVSLDSGHYPFFNYNSWQEIISI